MCLPMLEREAQRVSILTLSKIQESGQLAHFYFFV